MPINLLALVFVGVLVGILYVWQFAARRPIEFSYASKTCRNDLIFLPQLSHVVGTTNFAASYSGGVNHFFATKICFMPQAAPTPGVIKFAYAPFGSVFFGVNYQLSVPPEPELKSTPTAPQPLGTALALRLSQSDAIFQYYLSVGSASIQCPVAGASLDCDLTKLGLAQGATYTLKLERRFHGRAAGPATALAVQILPPVNVAATSITPGGTIFSIPKNALITFTKPVSAASAQLTFGNGQTPVPLQITVRGQMIQLAWFNDLPRATQFTLSITKALSTDGSTLGNVFSEQFQTSGGPKVISSSIGANRVPGNAQVFVTFDQPLKAGSNVSRFASIAGGSATISQSAANQIEFTLNNLPLCGAFTLTIAPGLVGANDVMSDSNWSQTSRISCGTSQVIGYSVLGRPIVAYFFGTGPTTILFCGGIHGSEPSGYYLMQDWANYLDANGNLIPSNKTVVVVPELNPDGIAADLRYNAHNVNLDRNFPTSDWQANITVAGGATLVNGGGPTPGSEPETQAIMAFIRTLHNVRAEFSFHAEGSLVGANKIADSTAIGNLYASTVGYATVFYNPEQVFGYTLTGELETWEGEQFGLPAVLIELPTNFGHYLPQHLTALWLMVNLQ